MSRLQQSNGDDYPEAAGKHLEDAQVLMAGARHDGTAYLAGYVVECALKTLIQVETGQQHYGHDLSTLNRTSGTLAAQAGLRTQRIYAPATTILRNAAILKWKPDMRYQAAKVAHTIARKWLEEAENTYKVVIGGLKMDGLI